MPFLPPNQQRQSTEGRLAYGPADATATHCLLLQLNPDWFYLLVPAHLGSPGQRAVKRVCVCVNVDMKAQKARKISCKNSQPLENFFRRPQGVAILDSH